jgi:hypothetical protein
MLERIPRPLWVLAFIICLVSVLTLALVLAPCHLQDAQAFLAAESCVVIVCERSVPHVLLLVPPAVAAE